MRRVAAISDHVEALVRVRRDKETGDMIEFSVADAIPSGGGARVHARSAHFIGNVEEVKLVRRLGLLEKSAHPPPPAHGVGVKVENDRNSGPQQADDMRASVARSRSLRSKQSLSALISDGYNFAIRRSSVITIVSLASPSLAQSVDFPAAILPHNICSAAFEADMTVVLSRRPIPPPPIAAKAAAARAM
jgi:hypothetical protein